MFRTQENIIEYEKLSCSRPHCAIRSHNHVEDARTFAEFLNYLPHFWTISRRYNLDNKKLIKTYKYFDYSDNVSKEEIIEFIKDILDKINNETKDIELKKLRILYLYSILSTRNPNKIIKQSPKLFSAVNDAFNRAIIGLKDELFSEQMAKITL
jgi:hypothetical protein